MDKATPDDIATARQNWTYARFFATQAERQERRDIADTHTTFQGFDADSGRSQFRSLGHQTITEATIITTGGMTIGQPVDLQRGNGSSSINQMPRIRRRRRRRESVAILGEVLFAYWTGAANRVFVGGMRDRVIRFSASPGRFLGTWGTIPINKTGPNKYIASIYELGTLSEEGMLRLLVATNTGINVVNDKRLSASNFWGEGLTPLGYGKFFAILTPKFSRPPINIPEGTLEIIPFFEDLFSGGGSFTSFTYNLTTQLRSVFYNALTNTFTETNNFTYQIDVNLNRGSQLWNESLTGGSTIIHPGTDQLPAKTEPFTHSRENTSVAWNYSIPVLADLSGDRMLVYRTQLDTSSNTANFDFRIYRRSTDEYTAVNSDWTFIIPFESRFVPTVGTHTMNFVNTQSRILFMDLVIAQSVQTEYSNLDPALFGGSLSSFLYPNETRNAIVGKQIVITTNNQGTPGVTKGIGTITGASFQASSTNNYEYRMTSVSFEITSVAQVPYDPFARNNGVMVSNEPTILNLFLMLEANNNAQYTAYTNQLIDFRNLGTFAWAHVFDIDLGRTLNLTGQIANNIPKGSVDWNGSKMYIVTTPPNRPTLESDQYVEEFTLSSGAGGQIQVQRSPVPIKAKSKRLLVQGETFLGSGSYWSNRP